MPSTSSSFSAVTATLTSPYASSGTPNTAHSAMRGCVSSTASVSSALTLNPPVFIMSTEVRPSIRQYPPSSLTAVSPVRKNPSGVNELDVTLGAFQYSLNTVGPLTSNSPGPSSSPGFTSNLTSTPGRGLPTVPARLSP